MYTIFPENKSRHKSGWDIVNSYTLQGTRSFIVKLGSRSKVYLKSQIRDLDLELVAIIAMPPPPPPTTQETFLSRITLKSLHV